jgi:hypothetical protein
MPGSKNHMKRASKELKSREENAREVEDAYFQILEGTDSSEKHPFQAD